MTVGGGERKAAERTELGSGRALGGVGHVQPTLLRTGLHCHVAAPRAGQRSLRQVRVREHAALGGPVVPDGHTIAPGLGRDGRGPLARDRAPVSAPRLRRSASRSRRRSPTARRRAGARAALADRRDSRPARRPEQHDLRTAVGEHGWHSSDEPVDTGATTAPAQNAPKSAIALGDGPHRIATGSRSPRRVRPGRRRLADRATEVGDVMVDARRWAVSAMFSPPYFERRVCVHSRCTACRRAHEPSAVRSIAISTSST